MTSSPHLPKRLTLNDVAARAGVSYMTVSRVVNNKGEISEETRRRVLEAIKELGYRPNAVARSLAGGRTCTIGVVTVELYRFAPSRITTGIQQRCLDLGYLLLVDWLSTPAEPRRQLDELASRQVDAVVWLGTENEGLLTWATPEVLRELPPIVFAMAYPQSGLHTVTIDNRRIASEATQHLMAQGRHCIGHISGPQNRNVPRDRLAGWREALESAGLPAGDDLVVTGDWTAASGAQAYHALVETHPELDAILVSNDRMALGVLSSAAAAGRRVPQDLAVTGFDNIPEAAFFIPPLTTVQQPLFELGRIAADLAIQLAEAHHKGAAVPEESATELPSQLIVRASTTVS